MSAAEIAYKNERYVPAKGLAEDVSTTLSDSFQASVLANRKAIADKAAAEKARLEAIAAARAEADVAMADAQGRMAWANENGIKADYPDQYQAASTAMVGSFVSYGNEDYASATTKAKEVSTVLSDEFQAKVAADRKAAEDVKAQLAADKAAADPAMADARTRMAWAENNSISADYPKEYKDAYTSMSAAEIAYKNERYVPAKGLAEDVSTTLSDSFQASVLADRKAIADKAAAEKARLEAIAAARSEADTAMADAQGRMAWANENGIKADYPDQYQAASTAMVGSFVSYGNEDYASATTKAKEVSTVLSDEFQAKVAADRKAAEDVKAQLAADKAAADPAMADARTRMAWAENNSISADYPKEYKDAYTSMSAAEIAYKNERYAPAKGLAEDVSTILSDDFQKMVLAARAPKPEPVPVVVQPAPEPAPQPVVPQGPTAEELAAAAKAAAMATAKADIEKAQGKYDWAVSKNAQNNFPELLAKGGAELDGAKSAFASENFADASAKASAALATLSDIAEFAPLPAIYVVRLIPARRDCLWRIAEYPFIYNNPLKWPVLYEANKKTFKDPSNPDLIFPNQVLKIPSIKGETRSGTWDPKKTYNPLPKK
jgi:nucleoid-associated protein YgaU